MLKTNAHQLSYAKPTQQPIHQQNSSTAGSLKASSALNHSKTNLTQTIMNQEYYSNTDVKKDIYHTRDIQYKDYNQLRNQQLDSEDDEFRDSFINSMDIDERDPGRQSRTMTQISKSIQKIKGDKENHLKEMTPIEIKDEDLISIRNTSSKFSNHYSKPLSLNNQYQQNLSQNQRGLNPLKAKNNQANLLINQQNNYQKQNTIDSPVLSISSSKQNLSPSQTISSNLIKSLQNGLKQTSQPLIYQSKYNNPGFSSKQLSPSKSVHPLTRNPIDTSITSANQNSQTFDKNRHVQSMYDNQADFSEVNYQNDLSSNMSGNGRGLGYLSDSSLTRCKDFKSAYNKLQSQMSKHKFELMNSNYTSSAARLLLQSSSFKKMGCSGNQKGRNNVTQQINTQKQNQLFDRLYKEKDKYYETRSNTRDFKLEEELKECTFTPNSQRRRDKTSKRSFNQFYNEIIEAHQKSVGRLNELRQQKFDDEMKEVRSLSPSKERDGNKRDFSPKELSQKLYQEGIEKIQHKNFVATTKDLHKVDQRYTFKPKINQTSASIVNQKNPQRNPKAIAEYLYQEKQKQSKNKDNKKDQISAKPKINENSEKHLELQIERLIMETLSKIQFNQELGLDVHNLNQMLQIMKYVNNGEHEKVQAVFNLVGNGNHLGFDEIKTILCGIEGLYIESFMKGMQLYLTNDGESFQMPLDNPTNFNKFKSIMREFKINKQHQLYESKLQTIQSLHLSPKSDFKPQLSQKSIKLDKQRREKSLSKFSDSSIISSSQSQSKIDRVDDLLAKSKMYQTQKLKKIEEKLEHELDGCTFKPKVNKQYQFTQPSIIERHQQQFQQDKLNFFNSLYQMAEPLKQRKDKSTDEYEFEKGIQDCVFVPKINNPRISTHKNRNPSKPKQENKNTQSNQESTNKSQPQKKNQPTQKPIQKYESQQIQPPSILKQSTQQKQDPNDRQRQPSQQYSQCQDSSEVASGGKRLSSSPNEEQKQTFASIIQNQIADNRRKEIIKRNLINLSLQNTPDELSGQGQQQQAPLLYLEVNISEGMQARLMVFEHDQYEEVVEVFADYYQIGEAKKIRLMEIVKMQLAKILSNIGEAQDEEEESNISKEYQ